ncbi:uncharacterized protein LOC143566663 [Bidens hawaiensis]|uniref:uncharacterized protein LOC143566663 n=1 Tax=Bidens hawaiensis TaxID=980011 RepID=UPI004048F65F
MGALKPCNDSLTKLGIVSYGGLEFPNWVGDPSFLHLINVSIHGCKTCTSVPPLGQLPSLKELFIEGMDDIKNVGSDLTGTDLPFPSLKILEIKNMKRLEVWSTDTGAASFPCLQKLVINNCPVLAEVSLTELPSLNDLEIQDCDSGVLRRVVQAASSVRKLKIVSVLGLNDVVWNGVMEYLREVEELILHDCNEIRYLEVRNCQKLVRLGETTEEEDCGSNLITTLRTLEILKCDSMEHCRCPNNIEFLRISFCPSITSVSFPTKGQKLKSLFIYSCDKLLDKELGGDNSSVFINKQSMPMLQYALLIDWPNLTTVIELSHFIHLTSLAIDKCPNLESFPNHELPNLTSLTDLVIAKCPCIDASFPRGFWPPKLHNLAIGGLKKPILEWGPQNFPTSLANLRLFGDLSGEDGVSSSNQLSCLIPSSLSSLQISGFKKLKSLSVGLRHLISLQHLSLNDCPNIRDLPEFLLPALLRLNIDDCPRLEGRCRRRGSSYWSRISHIPCIRINTGSSPIF